MFLTGSCMNSSDQPIVGWFMCAGLNPSSEHFAPHHYSTIYQIFTHFMYFQCSSFHYPPTDSPSSPWTSHLIDLTLPCFSLFDTLTCQSIPIFWPSSPFTILYIWTRSLLIFLNSMLYRSKLSGLSLQGSPLIQKTDQCTSSILSGFWKVRGQKAHPVFQVWPHHNPYICNKSSLCLISNPFPMKPKILFPFEVVMDLTLNFFLTTWPNGSAFHFNLVLNDNLLPVMRLQLYHQIQLGNSLILEFATWFL